jgi:hypothetical protein
MRDLLREVLDLQPSWSNTNTPAMQRRGILIRQAIPRWLEGHIGALSSLLGPAGLDCEVEGRDGTGQKSEIPWVRVYSRSRSPSANEGWYCVYLFRSDGTGVYLCLGQASTRYQDGDFKPRSSEELARLVAWAKEALGASLTAQAGLAPEIKLHSRGRLGEAYERGTVCSKFYDAANLLDEYVLLEDLKSFIRLLRILYDADDLGRSPENREPEVRAAEQLTEVLAAPLRSRGRNGQGFGLTAEERRVVERQAMDVAHAHLVSAGYVVEDVSKRRPYDFVATRDGGSIIVEVKGTTGGLGSVVLTTNEVTAHQSNHPDNALIVVHSIELERTSDPPRASGGVLFKLHPWTIDATALQPLSFQYVLPSLPASGEGVE